MPRSQSRMSRTGRRSCHSPSRSDIIARQKQYLRKWNEVGLKPILKELDYALRQLIVDHEKAFNVVKEVKERAVEKIRLFFKPIEDKLSAKNENAREGLHKMEKKITKEQNRLKNFIRREEDKCKRGSPDFDKDAFLAEAERLKLSTSRLAIRESVICISRVEIDKMEAEVEKFHNQIQQALETVKPDDLLGITECKQEFKARITTPPELCTFDTGSPSTDSTSQSTLSPHPPSSIRSKSACSKSRKSLLPPSTKTSHSMDVTKQTFHQKYDVPTPYQSLSAGETPQGVKFLRSSTTLWCQLTNVGGRKYKPVIPVSPQKSTDNEQGIVKEFDHPYGVAVLSNGNKAVVETNSLKITDNDTKEIVQSLDLYNRDEAKATGCCDLTVLRNDDIIVCDSQRRKLLLTRPGSDRYEIFLTFDEGLVPRAIANDGKILYVCLSRELEDGVLEKVDIDRKYIVGRIALKSPAKCPSQTGATVCKHSVPKYVTVNSRQELLVSDALNGILWFIDGKDNVRSLTKASIPGLSRPTGICWLSQTRFVVAVQDVECHQLLVVEITGINNTNVINRYGRKGDQPNEFNSPEGMALHQGQGSDQLIVCDLMNSRLNTVPLSFLEDASSV